LKNICALLVISTAVTLAVALHVSAMASAAPVQYALQVANAQVAAGEAPALRIAVTNITAAPITHAISIAEGYTVRISGPTGYAFFSTRASVFPSYVLRLQPGETKYVLGSATGYFQADPWYFSKTGTYYLTYCDRWIVGGRQQDVCTSAVEVHVGNESNRNTRAVAASQRFPIMVVVSSRTRKAAVGESVTFKLSFFNDSNAPLNLYRYDPALAMVDLCIWQTSIPSPSPTPSPTPSVHTTPWATIDIDNRGALPALTPEYRAARNAPLSRVLRAPPAPGFNPSLIVVDDRDEWFDPQSLTLRFKRAGVYDIGAVPSSRAFSNKKYGNEPCPKQRNPGAAVVTVTGD
jgi:hypothetical protein